MHKWKNKPHKHKRQAKRLQKSHKLSQLFFEQRAGALAGGVMLRGQWRGPPAWQREFLTSCLQGGQMPSEKSCCSWSQRSPMGERRWWTGAVLRAQELGNRSGKECKMSEGWFQDSGYEYRRGYQGMAKRKVWGQQDDEGLLYFARPGWLF